MTDTNRVQVKRNGTSSILAILGRIAIMVMFTESMLIPALPTLQAEFNSTATWTAWILSIYLVAGTVSTPIFGKLGDSYGKKKMPYLHGPLHVRRHRQRVCVEHTESLEL